MRITNRTLAIVAVILWLLVAAMFAYIFFKGVAFGSSDELTTTTTTSRTTTSSPATTASAAAATTTTEAATLSVAAAGDVMGDRKVGTFIDKNGGAAVFTNVGSYFRDADLAFVNLESPLSNTGTERKYKEYTFRGRPALIEGLTSAGIDVVSLANNHQLDWSAAALKDEISRLDSAGVKHAGAGANSSAAAEPAIVKTNAGTVALLAYTQIISSSAATSSSYGTNPGTSHSKVVSEIKAARKRADFVIVSMHWGTEYTNQETAEQRSLAHAAVDAGADLVLGHHPHVIQGLEIYKNKLIAYSMGDFVFDHRNRVTGEAFILRVTLAKTDTNPVFTATPVYLSDTSGIPSVVSGSAGTSINSRLISYSNRLGLKLVQSGGKVKPASE